MHVDGPRGSNINRILTCFTTSFCVVLNCWAMEHTYLTCRVRGTRDKAIVIRVPHELCVLGLSR